jgi:hypothetical protein
MNDYEAGIRILPDSAPRLSRQAFRQRLTQLLEQFLAGGGDPWWLCQELSTSGMAAIDNLRCDLVDTE